MATAKFPGFPKQTAKFLRDLTKNNNKTWFDAHRSEYEQYYMEPAKAFVAAISDRLDKVSPGLNGVPRVGGSIFRINRDIRFSKDKTPYRNHLDLWFYEGNKRQPGKSGLFFRMHSNTLLLGAGVHGFEKAQLAKFRKAVAADSTGKKLTAAIKKVEKAGFDVAGEHYKKVPKGFDPEHPRADLLKFAALHAGLETKLPKETHTPKFIAYVVSQFKKAAPLHQWIRDCVK